VPSATLNPITKTLAYQKSPKNSRGCLKRTNRELQSPSPPGRTPRLKRAEGVRESAFVRREFWLSSLHPLCCPLSLWPSRRQSPRAPAKPRPSHKKRRHRRRLQRSLPPTQARKPARLATRKFTRAGKKVRTGSRHTRKAASRSTAARSAMARLAATSPIHPTRRSFSSSTKPQPRKSTSDA